MTNCEIMNKEDSIEIKIEVSDINGNIKITDRINIDTGWAHFPGSLKLKFGGGPFLPSGWHYRKNKRKINQETKVEQRGFLNKRLCPCQLNNKEYLEGFECQFTPYPYDENRKWRLANPEILKGNVEKAMSVTFKQFLLCFCKEPGCIHQEHPEIFIDGYERGSCPIIFEGTTPDDAIELMREVNEMRRMAALESLKVKER